MLKNVEDISVGQVVGTFPAVFQGNLPVLLGAVSEACQDFCLQWVSLVSFVK